MGSNGFQLVLNPNLFGFVPNIYCLPYVFTDHESLYVVFHIMRCARAAACG